MVPVHYDLRIRNVCKAIAGWAKPRNAKRLMTIKGKKEELKSRMEIMSRTIGCLSKRDVACLAKKQLPANVVYITVNRMRGALHFAIVLVRAFERHGTMTGSMEHCTTGVIIPEEKSKWTCKARIQALLLWSIEARLSDDVNTIILHDSVHSPTETLKDSKDDAAIMWALALRQARNPAGWQHRYETERS